VTRPKPAPPTPLGPLFDDTTRESQLRAETIRFHEAHPEVWRLFEQFALELVSSGVNIGGAKAIWERLRWETQVNPDYRGREVKLNNNYTAFYARAFLRKHPKHEGFFRTRTQPSASATART